MGRKKIKATKAELEIALTIASHLYFNLLGITQGSNQYTTPEKVEQEWIDEAKVRLAPKEQS